MHTINLPYTEVAKLLSWLSYVNTIVINMLCQTLMEKRVDEESVGKSLSAYVFFWEYSNRVYDRGGEWYMCKNDM